MRRYKISVTTVADGSATAVSPRLAGKLHSIQYVADGVNPYASTVDFTITAKATGENIWTESNIAGSAVRYPRANTHSQVGAASLYAASGTNVQDKIGIAGDQVQIVLAQGGNAKVGVFHILID